MLGTKRSSTSVTVTLSQARSAARQRPEEQLGRRAAGDREAAPCRAPDGRASLSRNGVGKRFGQLAPIGEPVQMMLCCRA